MPKRVSVLRVVNISKNDYDKLHQFLRSQEVQYEFEFCEQIPEQIVKNLFDNVNQIDLNAEQYANSPVIRSVIDNARRHVQGREI